MRQSPRSLGLARARSLKKLLNSGPQGIVNGLNYRYAHQLWITPDTPAAECGISWALGVLEQLAENLIRLKGLRETRRAREMFCDQMDLVLGGGHHGFGGARESFSTEDEAVFVKAKRSLRSALVALWEAPSSWLARLRRCANPGCAAPFFLDRSAKQGARYCGDRCRLAAWRSAPSRLRKASDRGRRQNGVKPPRNA